MVLPLAYSEMLDGLQSNTVCHIPGIKHANSSLQILHEASYIFLLIYVLVCKKANVPTGNPLPIPYKNESRMQPTFAISGYANSPP